VSDRIDRYLEGTLDRDELTPDERAAAELIARVIEGAQDMVRAAGEPNLAHDVMRHVREQPKPGSRSAAAELLDRLWAKREVSFRLRPIYGAMAVAALLTLAVVAGRVTSPARETGETATPATLLVQFRLQLDEAMTVRLAGSFTNWQPDYELHQSAPGVWTVTIPLGAGVHDYAFVVDGNRWLADPYAPAIDDGFGGRNSRIALLPPGGPRS
jgi:hypothetical protein